MPPPPPPPKSKVQKSRPLASVRERAPSLSRDQKVPNVRRQHSRPHHRLPPTTAPQRTRTTSLPSRSPTVDVLLSPSVLTGRPSQFSPSSSKAAGSNLNIRLPPPTPPPSRVRQNSFRNLFNSLGGLFGRKSRVDLPSTPNSFSQAPTPPFSPGDRASRSGRVGDGDPRILQKRQSARKRDEAPWWEPRIAPVSVVSPAEKVRQEWKMKNAGRGELPTPSRESRSQVSLRQSQKSEKQHAGREATAEQRKSPPGKPSSDASGQQRRKATQKDASTARSALPPTRKPAERGRSNSMPGDNPSAFFEMFSNAGSEVGSKEGRKVDERRERIRKAQADSDKHDQGAARRSPVEEDGPFALLEGLMGVVREEKGKNVQREERPGAPPQEPDAAKANITQAEQRKKELQQRARAGRTMGPRVAVEDDLPMGLLKLMGMGREEQGKNVLQQERPIEPQQTAKATNTTLAEQRKREMIQRAGAGRVVGAAAAGPGPSAIRLPVPVVHPAQGANPAPGEAKGKGPGDGGEKEPKAQPEAEASTRAPPLPMPKTTADAPTVLSMAPAGRVAPPPAAAPTRPANLPQAGPTVQPLAAAGLTQPAQPVQILQAQPTRPAQPPTRGGNRYPPGAIFPDPDPRFPAAPAPPLPPVLPQIWIPPSAPPPARAKYVFGNTTPPDPLSLRSAHPVIYQGETFQTAQHLLFILRLEPGFHNAEVLHAFRIHPNPVAMAGRYPGALRQRWWGEYGLRWQLTRLVVRLKVQQHEYVREALVRTEDWELWDGEEFGEENLVGRALMECRTEIREGRTIAV